MKNKISYIIPLISLLLVGCNTQKSGGGSGDGPSGGDEKGTSVIEIYSTNDFHGAIMSEDNNMGLAKWATFLKEKGEHENTLLCDQGDTWQGSIYSNYNHGALITDVMNYIKFDARSVGNHDFDWGTEYIAANTARTYDGYACPVLAGNVYDFNFETKEVGTTQQSDLGVKSVTYTLENGLKVGILGGIGMDQITSISSNYTMEIAFTNHINFIKQEATHLRQDEHCDVVIASIHTGEDSVMGYGLESYVDLVLCGHTHRQEYAHEGKLYYVQGQSYGRSIGHITLTYDHKEKDVVNTDIEYFDKYAVNNYITTIDETVDEIITTYNSECQTAADVMVASNVSGSFPNEGALANLMCKAIYDQCLKEGHDDVLLSFVNEARRGLYYYEWTYADLYEAFPFDNIVYIADITGREFKSEVRNWNYIYRSSSFTDTSIDDDKTYRIAVIDFIYFHTNTSRYYNFFNETGGTSTTTLSKNYREIIRDWLITNGYNTGKQLKASDYSSYLWQHDRGQLPE